MASPSGTGHDTTGAKWSRYDAAHGSRIRMILDGPDKGSWVAWCLDCDWTADGPMPSLAAGEAARKLRAARGGRMTDPATAGGVVVGIDTSSRGFHTVASAPIPMPGMAVPSRLGFCESKLDPQTRRHLTFSAAKDFFRTLPHGSTVAIEEPLVLPRNPDTTKKLVMMAGAIEAAFWQAYPDATLWWVNVSTWRRDVLAPAKGTAPRNKAGWKALARAYVLESCEFSEMELAVMESEPDLWDAACVMEYGRQVAAAAR